MSTEESRKAAIHARVSSENNEDSIQAQSAACRKYIQETGGTLEREYADQGGSRAQFEQMIEDATRAENPPFQRIVVYDLAGSLAPPKNS